MDTLVVLMLIGGGVATLITWFMSRGSPMDKKRAKLMKDYIADLEAECDAYRKELKSASAKLMQIDSGPRVQGSLDDVGAILPTLMPAIEQMAPRWAKPILGNRVVQASISKYIQDNPEHAGQMIGHLLGKAAPAGTAGGQATNSDPASMKL